MSRKECPACQGTGLRYQGDSTTACVVCSGEGYVLVAKREDNLVTPIEGYEILVVKRGPGMHQQAGTFPLHLSRVGGARVTNPQDLVTQIEDAVFKNEENSSDGSAT